jgi:hypothetical protein
LANPATRGEELKALLMQRALGFRADIIVYDLLGQMAYHTSKNVYPTDLVGQKEGCSGNEIDTADLEEKANMVMSTKLYAEKNIGFAWKDLNCGAKKKLLAWDFRNDKGRPTAKGAYLMKVFFRNSVITQQYDGGRWPVFAGPVLHTAE